MADEGDYGIEGDGEDIGDILDNLEEIQENEGEEIITQEGAQRELAKESRALQFLNMHHPECRLDYMEDVLQRLPVTTYPPDAGTDTNHRSVPYLTLFEKTKIIGFRANQIAQGGRSLIHVPPHVTDVLEIARLELEQKRLPYILKRPMPDGTFEYIRLSDLIIV
jgi:DNA-directed RNA polymerase I, II, and III subunit RPABC2